MKKFAFLALLLSIVLIVPAFSAGNSEKTQKIVFADLSWDSVMVHNRIAAFIIENGLEGNYETDFVAGGTVPSFTGLANGDIQIDMESWHSNFKDLYDKFIKSGQVVDLGKNLPDGPQGWYMPRYVVEGDSARGIKAAAPGLKSIDDLINYSELFPDPEDPSKGLIYLGISGWAVTEGNEKVFADYKLEEKYNKAIPGSDSAVAATMDAAYRKGEPWIGYWWEPTAIMGRLDMIRLKGTELPPADVNIIVNADFAESAPEVVDFLKKYSTTVAINNEFLAKIEELNTDAQGTAVWFLKNREDIWTKWVSEKTMNKVKEALKGM